MKKRSTLASIFLAFCVFAPVAVANPTVTTSTNPQNIVSVQVDSVDNVTNTHVALTLTAAPNGLPCVNNSHSPLVFVDPTVSFENTKAIVALATSAFLAGKKVQVLWSNRGCLNGSGFVNGILIS